jgi:ABC-type uncharacterized transport system permease subunit
MLLNQIMYKWFYLFSLSHRARSKYLGSMLSYLFSQIVRFLSVLVIWFSLIKNNQVGFDTIFTYYIVGEFFLLDPSPHFLIESDILRGQFSNKLLLPASTWFNYWIDYLGRFFVVDTIKLIIVIVIAVIGREYLIIPQLSNFVYFTISVIIAYFLNLLLSYNVGFLAFYFGNIFGFSELLSQMKSFLSGKFFPLYLLPYFGFITSLPFTLLYHIPLQIYLGSLNNFETLNKLILGALWVLILFFTATIIYKKGLHYYEATGI